MVAFLSRMVSISQHVTQLSTLHYNNNDGDISNATKSLILATYSSPYSRSTFYRPDLVFILRRILGNERLHFE